MGSACRPSTRRTAFASPSPPVKGTNDTPMRIEKARVSFAKTGSNPGYKSNCFLSQNSYKTMYKWHIGGRIKKDIFGEHLVTNDMFLNVFWDFLNFPIYFHRNWMRVDLQVYFVGTRPARFSKNVIYDIGTKIILLKTCVFFPGWYFVFLKKVFATFFRRLY